MHVYGKIQHANLQHNIFVGISIIFDDNVYNCNLNIHDFYSICWKNEAIGEIGPEMLIYMYL